MQITLGESLLTHAVIKVYYARQHRIPTPFLYTEQERIQIALEAAEESFQITQGQR